MSEKLARTFVAAALNARGKPVPLRRIAAALEDSAILAAAEGHVSSLCEEEETAHWSDVDTWEAGSLPQPPGFDVRDLSDQAIIRAALAERIREVLGEA
jgi:DNA topoisomerase IA